MTDEQTVRIQVIGSTRLRDSLLSVSDGGSTLTAGLREVIAAEHPDAPAVAVAYEPSDSLGSFRKAWEAGAATRVRENRPDIVVLSVESDVLGAEGVWGSEESDRFHQDLAELVGLIKEDLGSHIVILNASSADPAETVSAFQDRQHEPNSLRAHRFNLAVMRVSYDDAISIVDTDRLVAELGATTALGGFLEYRRPAQEAICREFVRVVEDYGFLDNRPLLPQVGRNVTG